MFDYQMKEYTKAELRKLYDDEEFWKRKEVPFSRQRLAQYLINPYADEDDVLWLIVWNQDELIGYHGLVPDIIKTIKGPQKISWLSSWWVSPNYRGKGIAKGLLQRCSELNPYYATDSGAATSQGIALAKGYLKIFHSRPRSYWLLGPNLRFFQDFNLTSPIIESLYHLSKPLFKLYSRIRLKKLINELRAEEINLEYIRKIDRNCMDLIGELSKSDLCQKSQESLEWRINNLNHAPRLKGIQSVHNSFFGNVGNEVQSYSAKMYCRGELIGFISLMITDRILKLPYLYAKDGYGKEIIALVARICMENRIEAVYSQNQLINTWMKDFSFPYIYKKSYMMNVLRSPSLDFIPDGLIVQDGEGAF